MRAKEESEEEQHESDPVALEVPDDGEEDRAWGLGFRVSCINHGGLQHP